MCVVGVAVASKQFHLDAFAPNAYVNTLVGLGSRSHSLSSQCHAICTACLRVCVYTSKLFMFHSMSMCLSVRAVALNDSKDDGKIFVTFAAYFFLKA